MCTVGGWASTDNNAMLQDKKTLTKACQAAVAEFLPKFGTLAPALQQECLDLAADPNANVGKGGAAAGTRGKGARGASSAHERSPLIPASNPKPTKKPRGPANAMGALTKKVLGGEGTDAERAAVLAALRATAPPLPLSLEESAGEQKRTVASAERPSAERPSAERPSAERPRAEPASAVRSMGQRPGAEWMSGAREGVEEMGSSPSGADGSPLGGLPKNLVGFEKSRRESAVADGLSDCSANTSSTLLELTKQVASTLSSLRCV